MPVDSGPEGYPEFERIAAEHPDDAWNLAFNAGRDATPDPTRWVPMERFREVVLGLS